MEVRHSTTAGVVAAKGRPAWTLHPSMKKDLSDQDRGPIASSGKGGGKSENVASST
jgi:hypothetical protein